jgi:hypothetical protein
MCVREMQYRLANEPHLNVTDNYIHCCSNTDTEAHSMLESCVIRMNRLIQWSVLLSGL